MSDTQVSYSYTLIAASVAMSVIASYAAFCFAERITLSTGVRKNWWLGGGSLVMGLGIWSMHYLGMLAVHLSVATSYSLPIVIVSLLLAIVASGAALHFVSRPVMNAVDLLLGCVLMGGGVGAMHYTGMAAMRSCAVQHYSPLMVAVSVLIAVFFAWVSLSITFHFRSYGSDDEWLRCGGALLMGSGIAAMHYTAMGAVTFIPDMGHHPMMLSHGTMEIKALSGIGVTATTLIVLVGALLAAFLDRVTCRTLNEAHLRLVEAHAQLAHAQDTLLESEASLREANRQLHELSIRDGLTKLYNRRHLDETLQTEWRQAKHASAQISLLMIDVDFFKGFNDEYGHPAGDRILQQIAALLEQSVQGSDSLVARYGGEEFAVIAPFMNTANAVKIAGKICHSIFALGIPNLRSAEHKSVSVSVGVCSIVPTAGDSLGSFVHSADKALYRAKELGRNRVHAVQAEPFIASEESAAADYNDNLTSSLRPGWVANDRLSVRADYLQQQS